MVFRQLCFACLCLAAVSTRHDQQLPAKHPHRQIFRSGVKKLKGETALQAAKDPPVTAALDSAYSEVTSMLSKPGASNMAAADKGQEEHKGKQMPVQAHLSMDSVRSMLNNLSPECAEQFGRMMEGKGRAKQLHLFGSGQFEASEETCSDLGGAICDNQAKIRQTQVAGDGRRLVVDSKIDGKSCLPRKCIQEADLEHLATFVQRIAVKNIGPASQGQKAAQVILDVDCSGSGGGSYAGQSQWSAKEAGAVDPKPLPDEVHSDTKRQGPPMLLLSALISFTAFLL